MRITEKDNEGKDEWYGYWYKCPHCASNMIMQGVKFCSNCGVPLEFDIAQPASAK